MFAEQAESLRKAVENLMNAKLQDILMHSNALGRLIAHRGNGVSSPDVRKAEQRLEQAFTELLSKTESHFNGSRGQTRAHLRRDQYDEGKNTSTDNLSTERFGNEL
jgi:hypothetical protein